MPAENHPTFKSTFSPALLRINSGRPAQGWLIVTNTAPHPTTFSVSIEGLEADEFSVSSEHIQLEPDQQGCVSVLCSAYRQPAGACPVTVTVAAAGSPAQPQQHQAILQIDPAPEIRISEFWPPQQTVSRFSNVAHVNLGLTNMGNCPVPVRLSATASGGHCRFEFASSDEPAPLAGQITLTLAPGEEKSVLISVQPPPRPLLGLSRRTTHFSVSSTVLAGGCPSQSLAGQVRVRPYIGPGLLVAVGLLVLLLLPIVWGPSLIDVRPPAALTHPDADPVRVESKPAAGLPGHLLFGQLPAGDRAADPPQTNATASYEEMFKATAAQYNLDWRVLAELAYQESRMNPLAVGRDNDMGLMQIIPTTWSRWAPQVGVTDPFDPYSNIQVGAAYLAYARDVAQAHGYTQDYWMLIGYNWGTTNLDRLLAQNGTWAQVPLKQQYYALTILQAAQSPAPRWQNSTP